ncbi:tetratricopeptide repeat protein [Candidatus Bathyarchaeota archaeon]|nr:MAG: tetratricopeptide repeat protein [Candidatus Bathyarchaeota archaeon]
MPEGERRLAAIMFTDLVGFTALGQRNESLALSVLDEQRELLRPLFNRHGGREVKTIGDAFLVDFTSALNAVKCAYEIQKTSREFNDSLPEERRVLLRIGVHLGDIVESHGDISGDAVNIASRIESLADSGGVCLTRQVYDQVQNKFDLALTSLGLKSLKNVTSSIEVYKMVMPWEAPGSVSSIDRDARRIVILPFANISPDIADEYFADGMTDELIAVLSKIGSLRVVARTSAMRFKGEKATANRIGQELKVGSLIEGSVRKSKNRVRITVQLVDTQSEEQLWTETYDRDLQDIFSVQSDIAQQVASALELRLGVRENSALLQQQTQNPEAYSLYLKGRNRWNLRSENEINRAIKYFEEAIGRDPGYALAYAGLADCYSILGYYGFRRSTAVLPRAKELAEKALSLNDSLAEAHASLGEILMQYYFDWKRAGSELDRAIELNPSYATAHFWRATHYMALGRIDESLAQVRKAVELDPLSMIILTNAARDLYLAGRYDESIDQYRRSLQVDHDFPIAHKGLAEVYTQKGMHEEALREIERAILLSERSIFILDDLGYVYACAGKLEEARKVLEDLDGLATDQYVSSYGRAVIHAALGEKEIAMAWLEKAYEERSFLVYIKVDPAFDVLRKEEKFARLLDKMGL